jgi:uncharacterized protein (DUF433 family)
MEQCIVINPEICGGRPVIAGTRITVQTILEFLGAGDSIDYILAEYPSLSRKDVLACLRYSSQLMGNHSASRRCEAQRSHSQVEAGNHGKLVSRTHENPK